MTRLRVEAASRQRCKRSLPIKAYCVVVNLGEATTTGPSFTLFVKEHR